jgi:hypothetical protein
MGEAFMTGAPLCPSHGLLMTRRSWHGQNEVWLCERCRYGLYGDLGEIMDEVLAELELDELARIFGLTVRR